MAESTLSIGYADILSEVSSFLGYGESGSLTGGQRSLVDRIVQSGVRQFYYAPAVEGIEQGYEWSFLKPTGSLATTAETESQDLPDDLGRVLGSFYYEPNQATYSIPVVSAVRMLGLQQHSDHSGKPKYASVKAKEQVAGEGQRLEVAWWPVPDSAYTLSYRYEAYQGKLSEGNPYPLGGMKHSELVVESCLAIAEQRVNDEAGLHTQAFYRMLAAAIAQDRKAGAHIFGDMGGIQDDPPTFPRRSLGSSYDITYKDETW